MDAPVWGPSVFAKNRERLIDGGLAREFMAAVLNQAQVSTSAEACN